MKTYFGDTSYFLALINQADDMYTLATELTQSLDGAIVTTRFVLVEVGDALSQPKHRSSFMNFAGGLEDDVAVTIISGERLLFEEGLALFKRRPDKEWSLTDCISFAAMRRLDMHEALSSDHHFEQAGFVALLT